MDVFPYANAGNEDNYGNAIVCLMFMAYSKDKINRFYKGFQKKYIDFFYKEPKPAAIPEEQLPTDFRDFLTRWLERTSEDETKAYIKSWHIPVAYVNKTLKQLEDISDDPKYREVLYQTVSHKIKDKKCQFVFNATISSIKYQLQFGKPETSINIPKLMEDLEDLLRTKKKFEDGSEESEVFHMSKMYEAQFAHDFFKYFIPELRRVKPDIPIVGVPNAKGGKPKKLRKRKTRKISKRK